MSPIASTHLPLCRLPAGRRGGGWRTAAAAATACLLAGALALAAASPATAGDKDAGGEARHVRNPATPPGGLETRSLVERWRTGGDDPEILLGRIVQATADDAGDIYLLDEQLAQVLVFSADGRFQRTLSREGDGPGEVRRPSAMLLLPDRTVGLLQTFPGKLITITRDGDPARTVVVDSGSSMVFSADCRGPHIVVSGVHVNQVPGYQDRDSFLARIDAAGQEEVRYLHRQYRFEFEDWVFDEEGMYFAHWRWALGKDGRVYAAAARDEYAITVFAADGTVDRIIEREYESRRRSAEDLARVDRQMDGNARNVPFPYRKLIADTDPAIAGLWVAGDGALWVLPSRGRRDQPPGILRTYDVFDAEGRFQRQVALALAGGNENDPLFLMDDGCVIVVHGGGAQDGDEDGDGGAGSEPQPVEVVCYDARP